MTEQELMNLKAYFDELLEEYWHLLEVRDTLRAQLIYEQLDILLDKISDRNSFLDKYYVENQWRLL